MTTNMIVKLRRFLYEGFYMFSYAVRPATCFFVLLLFASAQESDLTVDNLTVTKDAAIYGQLNVGFIMGTNATVLATGGTITTVNTTGGIYRVHTFTNVGTTAFVVSGGPLVCEVLVVAGGGAGASSSSGIASGGGAGGVIYVEGFMVSGENTVTVGQGGAGAIGGVDGQGGENGGNSVFAGLTAIGGGHGKGWGPGDVDGAGNGGSGGGGTYAGGPGPNPGSGTPGQGHDGGEGMQGDGPYTTGGGGGAGSVGANGVSTKSGDGGIGIACSISGEEKYYGGGGAGGIWSGYETLLPGLVLGGGGRGGGGDGAQTTDGEDGEPNTGGGGGGTGNVGEEGAGPYSYGGDGGSGIVIVRYPITSVGYVSTLSISSNGISQTSVSATNVFMGKVGIGTESPEEKLHVSDNVRIDGALTFGGETRTNWPSGGGVAEGALMVSSNLADLADAAVARTNLGLGSAATEDASAFDAAGEAATVDSVLANHTGDFSNPHKVTAAQVGAVTPTGNGSQLTGITAGQVAGALIASNNLSDVADVATARNNLGALSAAGGVVNGSLDLTGSIAAGVPGGDIPMGVYTNQ